MANTHVLETVAPGTFRVAFHIPVPNANNAPGVNWRTIIAREVAARAALTPPVAASVLVDGDGTGGTITAAEKSQIVSGAVYEYVTTEKGQTLASVPEMFARRSAEIQTMLQTKYQQYGRTI